MISKIIHATITIADGDFNAVTTISTVVTSRTILRVIGQTLNTTSDPPTGRVRLNSSTQIEAIRDTSTDVLTVQVEVVETD